MKWRRGSNYHYTSDCGEYAVAKVIVRGAVQYEAWHMPGGNTDRQIALGTQQTTALAAQQICRKHRDNRGERAA